jgi:mannose-6-phosphate isomerase
VEKDFPEIDSFIIYMCTAGGCRIECEGCEESVEIKRGETVLIPAAIKNICFYPDGKTTLLEVYIKQPQTASDEE